MIACLCKAQSSYLPKECKIHDKNATFPSDQSISKNSLAGPTFPGGLSLGILFKASNNSFSVIHFSHSRDG